MIFRALDFSESQQKSRSILASHYNTRRVFTATSLKEESRAGDFTNSNSFPPNEAGILWSSFFHTVPHTDFKYSFEYFVDLVDFTSTILMLLFASLSHPFLFPQISGAFERLRDIFNQVPGWRLEYCWMSSAFVVSAKPTFQEFIQTALVCSSWTVYFSATQHKLCVTELKRKPNTTPFYSLIKMAVYIESVLSSIAN